ADPHRPTATAAPRHAQRDAYVESPRDVAAPQTCRQGPTGSAGPVFYGGATACSVASSGPSSVKRGGTVSGSTDICVPYGGGQSILGYDHGQEHEVIVTNADGELVYRFSDTVRFAQGAHRRTIGDGRCLAWTGTWDTTYTNGTLVPSGRYEVTLSLRPDSIGGRRTSAGEGGSMGFSVDVQ
ncbi:MAG: Intracellular proteinase inhibitor, partial [Frankiales bacterium]|nr:Intracellular proteinase inhibitor [Frankiales bacterium]